MVPQGAVPGSNLTIQAEDGRLFSIIIPEGVRAGDLLTVDIRDGDTGGSTVVRAEPASTGQLDTTAGSSSAGSKAALGAAAVGAVVGTLLIGPITGIV
jgi:hypothetical protein